MAPRSMIDGDASAAIGRTTASEPPRRAPRGTTKRIGPLAKLAEDLRRLVKEIDDKAKPRAVHQLRTTIRRFETLLPPVDDATTRPERKLRTQLDRIRKRAGKVRDADVHLRALRSLRASAEADARARVAECLEKERVKRRKRLTRTLAGERDRGLQKRLRKVIGVVPGMEPADAAAADAVLADVRARFAAALADATPLGAENLHAFRLHTKRLRYLAETAATIPAGATVVAQLKRVQDAIGAWHDWRTLAARAEAVLGAGPSPLLVAMRQRTQVQLEKALAVTVRVGKRLRTSGSSPARKGTRPVAPTRTAVSLRSAGATA